MIRPLLSALLCLALAAPAAAQSPPQAAPTRSYSGIVPGERDTLPHLKPPGGAPTLTWIGFLPEAERTRVFIQIAGQVTPRLTTSESGTEVELFFPSTRIASANLLRPIDTSAYERVVRGVDAARRGGGVAVTMRLARSVAVELVERDGYLFLEMPR